MIDERLIEDGLVQESLFAFAWRAFETVHPGQTFLPAWHVEALCHALEQVASGSNRRLVVNMPPRYGKSFIVAAAFPAWLLLENPGLKIMVASYGDALAADHARWFRKIVTVGWYKALCPVELAVDKIDEQITTAGGGRKAVTVGGPATGFGADLIIVDDVLKAGDATSPAERQRVKDFYNQSLFSRLNDKANGRIVSIQQRLHEDDLTAHLLGNGRFAQLNLRAIATENEAIPIGPGEAHRRLKGEALWPERESLDVLADIRLEMGPVAFSAQYQQDPTPPGGARMRWEWLKTYEGDPLRGCIWVVQSWDTGYSADPKADFSVGTTWTLVDGNWLLADVVRVKLDFPELKRRISGNAAQWKADLVLIEKAATGGPLVQQLRQDEGRKRQYQTVEIGNTPKEDRFEAQMARLETGHYRIPTAAPWLEELRRELSAFPNGKYDDQVDSFIQFVAWSGSRRAEAFSNRDPRTGRPLRVIRPQSMRRPSHRYVEAHSDAERSRPTMAAQAPLSPRLNLAPDIIARLLNGNRWR